MFEQIKSLRETVGREYEKPNKELLSQYKNELEANQEALDYLRKERGLNDETINHFQLGYSKQKNAISIPIFKDGELINFKYRLLKPNNVKYTQEAGCEVWIYNEEGLREAQERGIVLIVEGEFDLMSAYQKGIKNVISPASGKDSYGIWIAEVDKIPKVYIAYDNDEGGKATAMKIADRLGLEKSFEVKYPDNYKDANEYFKDHTLEQFNELVKEAPPFYSYQFKGLGDIIHELRTEKNDVVKLDLIPKVEIEKDWLLIVSGKSNIGKTSYALNIANKLAEKGIPTLVMPFERGINSVGKRFLQIKFDKTLHDFTEMSDEGWDQTTQECMDTPIYFSLPNKDKIIETIIKSRRLFDTRFVIIDHLDYIVRHSSGSREAEIANTLQTLKRVAEENGIAIIIVTHIRKIDQVGAVRQRKPSIEDLKGSSSLYQDPECVIMLTGEGDEIEVNVIKNKGEMTSQLFEFNEATGVFKVSKW